MKKFSLLFILAAAVLWGSMGLFVDKLTSLGFSTMNAALLRIGSAAIMYVVFLFVKDKKLLVIHIKDFWMFAGLGLLSILSMTSFYFLSIKENGSYSVAAILLYTAPVMVSLMSAVLFKERFGVKKVVALLLAFAGCVLVSGNGGSGNSLSAPGILYGLLSGFCYALYSIFGKVALRKYSPLSVSAYAFVFAAAGSLVLCDMPGVIHISSQRSLTDIVLWTFLTGIITAFLPFLFYTLGLQNTEPGKASILASVEPLAATAFGLVCGQMPSVGALLGIVSILASVCILTVQEKTQ